MEQRDHRSGRKKDAERQLAFVPSSLHLECEFGLPFVVGESARGQRIDDAEQDNRREHRSDENREQRARTADRGAHDRHECHVAKSHRWPLQPDFAKPPDDRDRARTDAHTEHRVPRAREGTVVPDIKRAERREQREEQTENSEAVGDEKILGVGYRDSEQDRDEYRDPEGSECHPELKVRAEPDQATSSSTIGILDRDSLAAAAAFTTQNEPAQDRNVFTRLIWCPHWGISTLASQPKGLPASVRCRR